MDGAEHTRQMLLIYQQARQFESNIRKANRDLAWEARLLAVYKRLRLIEQTFPDGRFVIEGDSGEDYYRALMELFGCIEMRNTELGLY